ncbi:UDP-glucose:(heptosyl)LPS alpha-1,3-glucosyltransferase [Isoptericola jiangsuensis]|uniref:UDP-glucose:(Heptosyl)LPS alpha-1,3-glucosyltransferase n=1 Tax=Isoptericola jiangsuensis TaxID=548579 RepID=A0A2A9EYK0_9MICO|nr:glycosyltransferase family 4 protein [Isoptericola jiangsuensis]PFG44227.1 UDP-glucose:(heptosyl)LPS alpha-1,3-glucosyltransferase [Isoptericola jiangsuensis]
MRIVQIVPEIGQGTGVGEVAGSLERVWAAQGLQVERFTLAEAGGAWIPQGSGLAGRLLLLARVVWFSTVGSVRARRYLRDRPDAVSICHNDALAGDVYVNHGLVQVAMRQRGHSLARMVRNPLHLFVTARDALRYRGRVHRGIVSLSAVEDAELRTVFGRVAAPTSVIGNGVDLDRFHPAGPAERAAARDRFGLAADDRVVAFIGNEHGRKGLPVLLEALADLDDVRLLVVGGDEAMVRAAQETAAGHGVADRCTFTGALPDAEAALHAADVFCLPSAYESFGLVYVEALACGVPVVATPVGCVPDVVDDRHGRVVAPTAEDVAAGVAHALALDPADARGSARQAALRYSWDRVAAQYLALFARLRPDAADRTGSSR